MVSASVLTFSVFKTVMAMFLQAVDVCQGRHCKRYRPIRSRDIVSLLLAQMKSDRGEGVTIKSI